MNTPAFLTELLHSRSPSGSESEAQAVFDRHVKPASDAYRGDALGNRIATLNPAGDPVLMLAGHLDELGLMITYVNREGYLYFKTIGGHDRSIISGRRVLIQTEKGLVKGVTGKRAIHLMDEADRKKAPEIHEIWIDIGATSKQDALRRVSVGDGPGLRRQGGRLHCRRDPDPPFQGAPQAGGERRRRRHRPGGDRGARGPRLRLLRRSPPFRRG
jgi:putative aminopeptidase FrvX